MELIWSRTRRTNFGLEINSRSHSTERLLLYNELEDDMGVCKLRIHRSLHQLDSSNQHYTILNRFTLAKAISALLLLIFYYC